MKRQIVNGEQLRSKELEEQQKQRAEQNERVRQRAEALLRKIGEACDELERLAEENPELVGRTTFAQVKAEEPVRETVDAETALSSQQSAFSQNQNPLTTEGTEDTEEGKTLPPMNADDTDKGEGLARMNADDFDSGQVDEQFVPMPGGYGYTRVRLKIEPERRPADAAIAPGDPAQPPPKGPQFQPQHAQTARASGSPVASELLEASTQGSALQAEPRANLG